MRRAARIAAGALALAAWLGGAARAQQAGSYQAATPVLASNLVAAQGANRVLTDLEVSADSTLSGAAWWIMVFDAASLPANGTVAPAQCYAMPSGTVLFQQPFTQSGPRFQTGITIGVSTTGCFTLTASVHAHIFAAYQ